MTRKTKKERVRKLAIAARRATAAKYLLAIRQMYEVIQILDRMTLPSNPFNLEEHTFESIYQDGAAHHEAMQQLAANYARAMA